MPTNSEGTKASWRASTLLLKQHTPLLKQHTPCTCLLPLPAQTKDGKIWNILDGDTLQDLIHNSVPLGRSMRIHVCCFRRARSIEVTATEY
jgi:hypothetical protein